MLKLVMIIFKKKYNTAHTPGLSCFEMVTTVFRMLTYGVAADATGEYVRIWESNIMESTRRFVKAIIELFGDEYLRSPNTATIQRNYLQMEKMTFSRYARFYRLYPLEMEELSVSMTRYVLEPTIILETVDSHNLWI